MNSIDYLKNCHRDVIAKICELRKKMEHDRIKLSKLVDKSIKLDKKIEDTNRQQNIKRMYQDKRSRL